MIFHRRNRTQKVSKREIVDGQTDYSEELTSITVGQEGLENLFLFVNIVSRDVASKNQGIYETRENSVEVNCACNLNMKIVNNYYN